MKFLVWAVLFGTAQLSAHETITTKLTWTQEISRIFYRRCMDCHGPKSAVPLTTYAEVRPWAVAIREEVSERRMPPWDAVRGFGDFRNDASLTQTEMDWIVQWVEGGAPKGNDIYLENLPLDTPPLPQPKAAKGLLVRGTQRIAKPVRVTGVEPRGLAEGGEIQVILREPDGSQRFLLWVRGYRKRWHRTYWLREAIALRPGAEILVENGSAFLTTSQPE